MDQPGSPACQGLLYWGQLSREGTCSQLPLVQLLLKWVGYLSSLPPKHFSELGLLSGAPAEAGGGNGGLDDIRGIAQ